MNNSFNTISRYEPSSPKSSPATDSLSVSLNPATRELKMSATGTPSIIMAGFVGACLVGGVSYLLYNQTKK